MTNIQCTGGLRMALDDYRGLSAYEIAVKNGFEGTEEEWTRIRRRPYPDTDQTIRTVLCTDGEISF